MKQKRQRFISCLFIFLFAFSTLFGQCRIDGYAAVSLKASAIQSAALAKVGTSYPNGYCLKFVEELYQSLGVPKPYLCCASHSGDVNIVSTSATNIPIGATVYFGNCGGGPCKSCGNAYYGHVGIYVGDGYFVHATGGLVQKSKLWANYRGYGYNGGFTLVNDLNAGSNNTVQNIVRNVENVSASNGYLYVSGWAYDGNYSGISIPIHVYVGEGSDQRAYAYSVDKERADVNNVFHISGNHGFAEKIDVGLRGRQLVKIYAISADNKSNALIYQDYVEIKKTAPKLHVWVTDTVTPGVSMGEAISSCKRNGTYYICYELIDNETGERFNSSGCSYTINETVTAPNGTQAGTVNYANSNYNWIRFKASSSGTYRGQVTISGDFTGSSTVSCAIPDVSGESMRIWISDSQMGNKVETLEKGKTYYLCYRMYQTSTNKNINDIIVMNYQVALQLTEPDGKINKITNTGEDQGYLTFKAEKEGTYNGSAVLSGDVNASIETSGVCKAASYTITYNLNGGSVTGNPAAYKTGASFTLNNPSRKGYEFVGWTGSGLSGTSKNVTVGETTTGNLNYTANWTPLKYSISYQLGGGTVEGNPTTYTIESNNITLKNPVRTGYTFTGWTGSNGTKPGTSVTIAKGTTGNLSYTANWEKIETKEPVSNSDQNQSQTATPSASVEKENENSSSGQPESSVVSGTQKESSENSQTVTASEKSEDEVCVMYRLYNPNSGEHFYTSELAEKDMLVAVGWNFEGIAWTSPVISDTPVYRVYNPNSGEHHYTASIGERNILISYGWMDEGIGWYSDENQTVAMYRLYNPNAVDAGAHHYTNSGFERDMLISIGWCYEGVGWYGR